MRIGRGIGKVHGGTVDPRRPMVCTDWLQAYREGSRGRRRRGRRGLTCSGVSSIAAESQT